MKEKPAQKIMLFCDWYEPGYKAGGPIRSCVNFVQQMKDDYTIYIFTSDRDLNEKEPYADLTADSWISLQNNVNIFYCSPEKMNWKQIKEQLKSVSPDFIYLNSMYSRFFTIYPLLQVKWGGWKKSKLVLAPRGMLRQSALQFKKGKKKLFLQLFKTIGLHKQIHFHATDDVEQQEVQQVFNGAAGCYMIPNFPGFVPQFNAGPAKNAGALKMIFIGRLHPIKGLDLILQQLALVNGEVQLTVIGTEEDQEYVQQCKQLASQLPASMQVHFKGAIPNNQLPAIIGEHHLFILPTRGENFGHAIFEALRMGKPVLISDQTPWRNLESRKAGWDLPLEGKLFSTKIQQAVNIDQEEYNQWATGAWNYAQEHVNATNLREAYKKLFS